MASKENLTMEEEKAETPKHKPLYIVLIVFAWLTYVTRLVIGWLNESRAVPGLFSGTVGNTSSAFRKEITPSWWTFRIWWVIWTWTFLWLIYLTVCICRKNSRGYVYVTPKLFPTSFYFVWYFNNFLLIAWRFLLDSQERVSANIVLGLTAFTIYYLMYVSYRLVDQNGPWLAENAPADLWLIRVLVHNGLAIFATWCTIASLLSLGNTLTDVSGYNNEDISTGILTAVLVVMLVWFCLENFVLDRYCRYTLVELAVVVVALSGILDKYYPDVTKRNVIYTCVLLGVACLLLLARVILVIRRHVTQPLYVKSVTTTSIKMSELNGGFA